MTSTSTNVPGHSIQDDELFARYEQQGALILQNSEDALDWRAERYYEPDTWPQCGCDRRCSGPYCAPSRFIRSRTGKFAVQLLHPVSNEALPPDWRDMLKDTERFRAEHDEALPCLDYSCSTPQPRVLRRNRLPV